MKWSPTKFLRRGLFALVCSVGGFSAWSVLTTVDGAVIAHGQVTVEARRQAVQHPDGGILDELHVRDGSLVSLGDPIITLDGTDLFSQQALMQRDLIETLARQDRLLAEIKGSEVVEYRSELLDLTSKNSDWIGILSDEIALFEARRSTTSQVDRGLAERQVQTQAAILGRERQLEASKRQLELIERDLASQEILLSQQLVEVSRISALQRDAARLEGEIGQLDAGIAEAQSTISGFQVERARLRASFVEEAQNEFRNNQMHEAELRQKLLLIEKQTDRLTLRAPMNGRVFQLQVHTVGGVVPAGAEVASIVPSDEPLTFIVSIDPSQIDRVHIGQDARIRFPNFNSKITPEVEAKVIMVSADVVEDPQFGRHYFSAELSLLSDIEAVLGEKTIIPGMPIEVLIRTDSRTPASFLLKPLTDYWEYAMREE